MKSSLGAIAAVLVFGLAVGVAWSKFAKGHKSVRAGTQPPTEAFTRPLPLQSGIVGKWKSDQEGTQGWEILPDGTFLLDDGATGRWSVVSDRRVKFTVTVLGTESAAMMEDVVATKEHLKMTLDGKEVILNRIK